jgi:hypothetical protein
MFNYIKRFTTTIELFVVSTKVGVAPAILGIALLYFGRKYSFINSLTSKMWLAVGAIICYCVIDRIVLAGYNTIDEIKKNNTSVAIVASGLLIFCALLWM